MNDMATFKKVLIVDDEEDFCYLLKSYLERKSFQVQVSHNLTDGMDKIKKYHPDYLFIDNNLPDGYGWDEVPSLLPMFPNMNVLLMSAYRKEGSEFSFKNDNCSFIEKPLNAEKLAQISKFLA